MAVRVVAKVSLTFRTPPVHEPRVPLLLLHGDPDRLSMVLSWPGMLRSRVTSEHRKLVARQGKKAEQKKGLAQMKKDARKTRGYFRVVHRPCATHRPQRRSWAREGRTRAGCGPRQKAASGHKATEYAQSFTERRRDCAVREGSQCTRAMHRCSPQSPARSANKIFSH